MKRKDILRKLALAGCILQEGGKHTKVYDTGGRYLAAVPRHHEIKEALTEQIARQTGVNLREKKQ